MLVLRKKIVATFSEKDLNKFKNFKYINSFKNPKYFENYITSSEIVDINIR